MFPIASLVPPQPAVRLAPRVAGEQLEVSWVPNVLDNLKCFVSSARNTSPNTKLYKQHKNVGNIKSESELNQTCIRPNNESKSGCVQHIHLQPAKMHSRNLRSNSSASANHIWLKALYFSRNPGKAVASTRHRKVDFHHFFKAYTSSHHLQMCISFETASFTWPLLGQLRKECIWFLHITPAVHLRYNIVHEGLFI